MNTEKFHQIYNDTLNIDDFGLSAEQLEAKYERMDRHPMYWRIDHRDSLSPMPYWEWVVERLQQEEAQLERDNPYR